jgi:hypothetical protein
MSMLRTLAKHALAGAFDENEVRILAAAFDQAWKAVEDSGAHFALPEHAITTRELLALRIIEMAQLGERDPNRLRDDALLYLTRTNLESSGL